MGKSLKEIAAEIDISRTTLYKVINNKGNVKESTRRYVEEALKKYDYTPNYNARDLARNRKYRIAYMGMEHLSAAYFFPMTMVGVERAINEFKDHGLELIVSRALYEEPEKQVAQIDEMLDQGIRNFIISVLDANVLAPSIKKLRDLNCKIVYHSRLSNEKTCTYFGPDYFNSGVTAGEVMGRLLPQGGNVLVLANSDIESDSYIGGRCNGFLHKLEEFENIHVVDVKEGLNTSQSASDYLAKMLREQHIDGVLDATYKTPYVAETLKQSGQSQSTVLIGFDVYKDLVPYIKSSVIDAVIGQDLEGQIYDCVRCFFEHLCYGKKMEEREYKSRTDIIMSTNVDDFV